ncbi:MAG: hypothetical protein ACYC1Z_08280 [Georgenia sp.]
MSTRSNAQQISDARFAEATGREREAWHTLLDRVGAPEWGHTTIARWLVTEHGVDGWWAQSITVGYEQARGLRAPGQRADGTFEVSVTKTLRARVEEVWPYLADQAQRGRWLEAGWPLMGVTESKSVRFAAGETERVLLVLDSLAAGADGRPRLRVTASETRLADAGAAATARADWRRRLTTLVDLLDGSRGPTN